MHRMSSFTSSVAVAVKALTMGPFREVSDEVHDFQIAGAEVLSPLGDAVGLVHGHHGNLRAGRKLQKVIALQPLRGYVDNLVHAIRRKGQRTSDLPSVREELMNAAWMPTSFRAFT